MAHSASAAAAIAEVAHARFDYGPSRTGPYQVASHAEARMVTGDRYIAWKYWTGNESPAQYQPLVSQCDDAAGVSAAASTNTSALAQRVHRPR
jgi:hypothetical protein